MFINSHTVVLKKYIRIKFRDNYIRLFLTIMRDIARDFYESFNLPGRAENGNIPLRQRLGSLRVPHRAASLALRFNLALAKLQFTIFLASWNVLKQG